MMVHPDHQLLDKLGYVGGKKGFHSSFMLTCLMVSIKLTSHSAQKGRIQMSLLLQGKTFKVQNSKDSV